MSPSTSTPPTALSLLSLAHPTETANRIHNEKVLQKPIHLTPTFTHPNTQATRRLHRETKKSLIKRKKALKPSPLSSRQRKALGVHNLPKKISYEVYIPLHELWMKYIQDLLGLTTESGDENGKVKRSVGVQETAKLCSADYHGAVVEVVRSRCVSRVGIKGIVVKDGMRAFEIVTGSKGKALGVVKRVPKEGTWFAFEVRLPEEKKFEGDQMEVDSAKVKEEEVADLKDKEKGSLKFELHGDQFIYRAADRANRKFKTHFDRNL